MLPVKNVAAFEKNPADAAKQPDSPGESAGLVSRNVTISGHRTSVRLEPDMWAALQEICRRERASMHEICSMVAQQQHHGSSMTAAIRVFIMTYFRAAATDEGHHRAGHGNGVPMGIAAALADQNQMRAAILPEAGAGKVARRW